MDEINTKDSIAVSVIVPVYNSREYLHHTLNSIINQTLSNIEIICVDDGSTDGSLDIIKKYQKIDSRIILLQQKNQFAGVARNTGMSKAKGKYLSFLDSDDIFRKDMLKKAYDEAETQDADIVIYSGMKFKETLDDAFDYPVLLNQKIIEEKGNNDFTPKQKLLLTTPVPWNKFFKRSFINDYGIKYQVYPRVNDAYFVLVALMHAKKIGIVNEKMVYYRTGNSGSLQGREEETPTIVPQVFFDIWTYMQSNELINDYRRPFQNLTMTVCLNALERFKSEKAFTELYNALKNKYYPSFQMYELAKEEFNSIRLYNHYILLNECSPMEYLLRNKGK